MVAQRDDQGALPTLYAATQDLPGASYVGPDGYDDVAAEAHADSTWDILPPAACEAVWQAYGSLYLAAEGRDAVEQRTTPVSTFPGVSAWGRDTLCATATMETSSVVTERPECSAQAKGGSAAAAGKAQSSK